MRTCERCAKSLQKKSMFLKHGDVIHVEKVQNLFQLKAIACWKTMVNDPIVETDNVEDKMKKCQLWKLRCHLKT